MKICRIFFLLLTTILLSTVSCQAASESIGIIKTVSGEVFLINTQMTLPALANMKIGQGDTIKTGKASSAGIIFEDDTVVSLGPNSEMAIANFLFDPVDKKLSLITRLVKGTFCFVTGQIAKLAPKNVTFETPEATLGVRGTKFLVKVD
ncbi:MAG: FecR family protein [Desulforhopalus sp.]|nr:FecR family protein [Desulforhopalus sp.]